MAKKSVTPSIRMDEDQYFKLKALKEKYNVSWNDLIKYLNRVLSEDMNKREDEKGVKKNCTRVRTMKDNTLT